MNTVDLRKLDDNRIVIHFGGQLTRVNAYTFANTLIAFADTIKTINELVNPGHQIELEIEAIGPGSFRLEIFTNRRTKGLLIAASAISIVALVMKLVDFPDVRIGDIIIGDTSIIEGDVTINVTTIEGDSIEIEQDGTRIIMPREVFEGHQNVKNNPVVRKNIGRTFRALKQDETIENFGLTKKLTDEELVVQIPRDSFGGLAQLDEDVISDDAQHSEKRERKMTLRVLKPWVDASKKRWSFELDNDSISALIEDEEFLDLVRSHEIRFGNEDAIEATVEYIERRNEESEVWTIDKTTYSVIKVYRFFEAGKGWTYFKKTPQDGNTSSQ